MLINMPFSPRFIQFFYDEVQTAKRVRTALTYTQADIEEFIRLPLIKTDIDRVQWYVEKPSGEILASGSNRRSYQATMIAMQEISKSAWADIEGAAPLSAQESQALIVFRNTQFTRGYTESRAKAGKQGGLFVLPYEFASETLAAYGLFLEMSEPQVKRDTESDDLHVTYQNKNSSMKNASSPTIESEGQDGDAYRYSYHFTMKQNDEHGFQADIDDKYQFQIDSEIYETYMLPKAYELLSQDRLRSKAFTAYMLPALLDVAFTNAFAKQYVQHDRNVQAYVRRMVAHAFDEHSVEYVRINKALDNAVMRQNIRNAVVVGVLVSLAVLAIVGIAAVAATGFGAIALTGVAATLFAAITSAGGASVSAVVLTALGAIGGLIAGVIKGKHENIISVSPLNNKNKCSGDTCHISQRLAQASGMKIEDVIMYEIKDEKPVIDENSVHISKKTPAPTVLENHILHSTPAGAKNAP